MDRKEKLLRQFGHHLTVLRKEKGMSIAELAMAAGLEKDQLIRMESGKVNLLFTTILALARGLDMPPDRLLESVSPGE